MSITLYYRAGQAEGGGEAEPRPPAQPAPCNSIYDKHSEGVIDCCIPKILN